MVLGLPVVLDCGEACPDAARDRAWNCCLSPAGFDEGSARISRTLFSRRMDRLGRVDRSWDLAACREECKNCLSSFCNGRETTFQANAKFGLDRALVYTFEGKLLSHR